MHRLLAVLLLSSFALAACQGYGPISPLLVVEKALLNGNPGTAAQALQLRQRHATEETAQPAGTLPLTPTVTSSCGALPARLRKPRLFLP